MRTEDLIGALARDAKDERRSVGQTLAVAWAAGIAVALALFLFLLGPRVDFAHAMTTPWYPLKLAVLGAIAVFCVPIAEALLRPGARVPSLWLVLPSVLLALAVAADLWALGVAGAWTRLQGRNGLYCVTLVPFFSVAPLVASLIAMRTGAPTSPLRAGLVAGLLSGAVGGLLYGLYCPDDSPLFVAVWYTIGIAVVASAGALAGRVLLRW